MGRQLTLEEVIKICEEDNLENPKENAEDKNSEK